MFSLTYIILQLYKLVLKLRIFSSNYRLNTQILISRRTVVGWKLQPCVTRHELIWDFLTKFPFLKALEKRFVQKYNPCGTDPDPIKSFLSSSVTILDPPSWISWTEFSKTSENRANRFKIHQNQYIRIKNVSQCNTKVKNSHRNPIFGKKKINK